LFWRVCNLFDLLLRKQLMTITRFGLVAVVVLSIVACSGRVSAVELAVANHTFEDPDVMADADPNNYIVVLPTGWTDNGAPSAFVEDCGALGFSGCDGVQYAGTDGGEIYQDLGVPFAPETTYTVDVATAHRSGTTHSSLEFGLYDSGAIGTDLATAGFADIQGVWTGSGNPDGDDMFNVMRDASVLSTIGTGTLGQPFTFTTGSTPPTGNVVVFLRNAGTNRVNFDNVRVVATAIPEPSSLLIAVGSGLLWATLRKRR
jgi:hypothetical protein